MDRKKKADELQRVFSYVLQNLVLYTRIEESKLSQLSAEAFQGYLSELIDLLKDKQVHSSLMRLKDHIFKGTSPEMTLADVHMILNVAMAELQIIVNEGGRTADCRTEPPGMRVTETLD